MGPGVRRLLAKQEGLGRDEWPHSTERETEAGEEHGIRCQLIKWQRSDQIKPPGGAGVFSSGQRCPEAAPTMSSWSWGTLSGSTEG